MCSGSETGSYLRLINLVQHSTLGLSVIKKNREARLSFLACEEKRAQNVRGKHTGRNLLLLLYYTRA
jgi:hypothetical protein